jgi:hypothetical protein
MAHPASAYNSDMPLDPITATIVGSIIGSAMNQMGNTSPPSESVPAVGVPRILPEGTTKGQMVVASPTSASVDGQPMILAPGVQIRDPFNMAVLPGMIQQPVPVRYLTDPSGAIARVWILSAQEASQP